MAASESSSSSPLADRGISWQAFGFALIGVVVLSLKRIYSESDAEPYRVFDTAVTQLYWAFALLVAWIIERIREVFETKANILANARRKIFRKGRVEENKRVRTLLKKHRVEVPPAVADELSKVPSGDLEEFREE